MSHKNIIYIEIYLVRRLLLLKLSRSNFDPSLLQLIFIIFVKVGFKKSEK